MAENMTKMSEEDKAQLATIRRAEKLLAQDEDLARRIGDGESIDQAVAESTAAFGPESHSEQTQVRVAKRAAMLKDGVNPYPVILGVTITIPEIRAKYDGRLAAGEETQDVVGVAGRVMFLRNTGGLCFVQLQAGDGMNLQGMISKKEIGKESLDAFKKYVDLGDQLFLKGRIVSSKTGELSVFASEWRIASKALRPLPALHEELNDDLRTRRPYLAMIVDDKARRMVRSRSAVISSLRHNFERRGYLEAETPILQTIHGGAAARPFKTHINAFDMNLYLRIAPELFLKRLLVGGIDKVFEINRNFRNEGVDRTHAPEFTALEAYEAYGSYDTMAELTKNLIQQAAIDAFGSTEVTLVDGEKYDLGGEWKQITMYESLSERLGEEITPDTALEHLETIATKLGLDLDAVENHGKLIEKLWDHFYTEDPHTLWEPTFVRDFPVETSPLTKSHRSKKGVTEKWDLYVRGFELGTAYSELNDPVVQRERLVQQAKQVLAGDIEDSMAIDEDFIEALDQAMPPAGGMGMGMDRLLIALTGATIRDTITFPLVKPIH
ncbi:MAG: lysine--tRNA ligase [Aeriscardovia sp.]|nr:lysine--tRNA ligase [Aeriscardovia sp.]